MAEEPAEQRLLEVVCGQLDAEALSCHQSATTSRPLEEVVERLRQAIERAGLWVLHDIDPQTTVMRDGYSIGKACQIPYFHPRLLLRAFTVDPAPLVDIPLKFAVVELAPGETVVRWFDPSISFGRYGQADLAVLGHELAQACQSIVQAAVGQA